MSKHLYLFFLMMLVVIGFLSLFLLNTPILGEIQLINKIYIMLMICYFILTQFGIVLKFVRHQTTLKNTLHYYLVFGVTTSVILCLVNRLGDSLLQFMGLHLSNALCFLFACGMLLFTWAIIKRLEHVK